MSHRCGCGPGNGGQVPVCQEFGTSTAGTGNRDRKGAGNRVARNDAAAPDAVTFTLCVPKPQHGAIVVVAGARNHNVRHRCGRRRNLPVMPRFSRKAAGTGRPPNRARSQPEPCPSRTRAVPDAATAPSAPPARRPGQAPRQPALQNRLLSETHASYSFRLISIRY